MPTSSSHSEHTSLFAGVLAFSVTVVTFTEEALSFPFIALYAFCDLFPVHLLEVLLCSYFPLQTALVISLWLIMLKPWLLQKLFPLVSLTVWSSLFFPVVPFCLTASPSIFKSHLKTSLLPCPCLLISLSLYYYVLFNFGKYLGMLFL